MSTAYRLALALAVLLPAAALGGCASGERGLVLAVGTTVQDTGLLDELVDAFEEKTGMRVTAVAVGTGLALEMGRRGDADVLLVHAPEAEEQFVAEGYGTNRRLVMHNDFVIVGPGDDPAGIRRAGDAVTAMHGIRKSEGPFISRGDDSGTHKLELSLWEELAFDPTDEGWYTETGQGMAATLRIADQREAYTISDRGTYVVLHDDLELEVLFEGDPGLINTYHVLQVDPERVEGVDAAGAAAFVGFMVSEATQALIRDFGLERYGEPLFIPDAGKSEVELPEGG